ncbi:MAG: serine--tRNA ligase [Patescibacteria group bacterium]|nr:serine--tRNA ligase [Patescibacteria group bacterium]
MLDIKVIRENPELVKEGVGRKGYNASLVDDVLQLDREYRELLRQVEELRAQRNKPDRSDAQAGRAVKEKLKELEPKIDEAKSKLEEALNGIPNMPLPEVPSGKDESENVVLRKWGEPPIFDFQPKDHLELGKSLNLLDFETGAKVAGSQFYFLYNEGALLELALVQYAFNLLGQEGFTPVITPDLAKSRYYLGTGYAPKGKEAQTYVVEGEDLGLIATAEVTLAGKHADEILEEKNLPLKYIGYSHCFRREAGAYGKYSKGLYRVHEFTKAEMFIYCLPEDSKKYHELILSLEEKIYQDLKIPYRVVEMCAGDLGAMAARKFDIEAWMPGRNDYGEVTSTSNCTDYQARNLNIRCRRADGTVNFVHMLNGTAIATSRTPLAILENYQNEDGSVTIPEVLRPYLGKDKIPS